MRSTTTISIDRADREHLAQLAKEAELTLGEMVHRLIKREQDRRFWREANAAYRRLREDPKAWAEYRQEFTEWDAVPTPLDPEVAAETWDDDDRAKSR
jgi:hypothetical protein